DILLAGHLAVRRGDTVRAADYADRVLADKRAMPNDVLSAAILILGITTPESPPHLTAWKRIEDLARTSGNAVSLNALVFLASQQSQAPTRITGNDKPLALDLRVPTPQPSGMHSPLTSDTFLSLGPGATPQTVTTMGLLEIADALEKHPDARPSHRLLALQLRVQHDPALTDQYVADGVERLG